MILCLPVRLSVVPLVALFIHSVGAAVSAEDGATIFAEKCAGCHTVGKGQLVGPDLITCKEQDVHRVKDSVTRMQSQAGPLTVAEIEALVQFIKAGGGDDEKPVDPKPDSKTEEPELSVPNTISAPGTTSTKGDGAAGKRIFMGAQSLTNGGMACAACHAIEGVGSKGLGPDLSSIATKMNEQALIMACEKTPYKVMKNAYKNNPVTHEEAIDLVAFLITQKGPSASSSALNVEVTGAVAAVVLVVAIALGYRKRKGAARDKLQRR